MSHPGDMKANGQGPGAGLTSERIGRRTVWVLALACVLALLPFAYLAYMSIAAWPALDRGYDSAFTRWTYYAVPWVLGAATFTASLGRGRPTQQALGLALMTVPLWETLWGILDSLVRLFQGGFVFRPFTRHELSSLYLYKLVEDLGYLTLGFLLYASPSWGDVLAQSPRRLGRALVHVGLPTGRRSEGRSMLAGLLVFPVLLVATIVVNRFLSGVESLNQSDETSIFDNMTLYHAVLISLAAAFTEELVYRGVLLVGLVAGLRAALRRFLDGRQLHVVVWSLAIVVQAIVFGFAHGGYGTWSHVLLPALFGLVAGLMAWAFGLWAPLVLHLLVDLVAFGAVASSNVPWLWQAIVWAFLANCGLTLAYAAWWVVGRFESRRPPMA